MTDGIRQQLEKKKKNGRVAPNGWFGDREGKNLLLRPGNYRISLDLQTGLVRAEPTENEEEK